MPFFPFHADLDAPSFPMRVLLLNALQRTDDYDTERRSMAAWDNCKQL